MGGVRDGLVLRLIDSRGEESWGEIAPFPGRSRETLDQALNQLLNILNSGKIYPARGISDPLFPSVQCGLESALSPPLTQTSAPLYAFLTGTPAEILQRAEIAHSQGYTTAKVKVASLSIDAAGTLLHRLKDRFRLRVDCNSAFSLDQALSLFSQFDRSVFDYIEDPTFETSRLADFPFPLALDETVLDTLTLLTKPHANLYGFILKPTILGGKKGCAPFIEFAKKHNLKIVFSPTFESGLGLLQILSVAKHFNLLSDPLGLDTHRYLKQDLLSPSVNFNTPQLTIRGGVPGVNVCLLKEISHGKCELPDL
jgi:o-succinylbenzoate synthase